MSWGHELWDQFENLSHHTSKGIDFCDKYAHFLRERCSIELRYAGELKRLVSNYLPKKKKGEENPFSYARGFISMLKELHDIASQHEVIAENTQSTIQKDTHSLVSELRSERRKHLQDCGKLQQQQGNTLQQLERSKKNYERAFRDAEKAQDAYKRADLDQNLSRAEVDKHSKVATNKGQDCVSAQKDYASQLQTTNKYQQEYYTVLLPDLYSSLQRMDERRVNKIQDCIKESANIERKAIPIINTCIDEIVEAANKINASFDSQIVIDKYKSGFQIPSDIPFEDLSNGPVNDNHTTITNIRTTPGDHRNSGKSATLSGQKPKKRAGLFALFGKGGDEPKEDFSDLQPAQRKKKLQQKIDQINKEVAKEALEREGMLKMKAVYVENSALGDPASLDAKVEENAQKLDKLNHELMKFETYLAEAEGRLQRRHSASDDNVSQSASEGSVNQSQNQFASAPGTPVQQHYEHIEDQIETFAEDEFSVIGTCRALYLFQATNEGSLDIGENEELSIIEQDQGDGWTRVRNSQNQEGFVPTSYIECHFYDADQV